MPLLFYKHIFNNIPKIWGRKPLKTTVVNVSCVFYGESRSRSVIFCHFYKLIVLRAVKKNPRQQGWWRRLTTFYPIHLPSRFATPAGHSFGVYTFILKRNHKKLKLKTRLSLLKEKRQGVYLFILTDRR